MNYYLEFQCFRMGFDTKEAAEHAKNRCGNMFAVVSRGWVTIDRRAFDRGEGDRRAS